MLVWWIASVALAGVGDSVVDVSALIADDLSAGLIGHNEALYLEFQRAWSPEDLPDRYAVEMRTPVGCLTGLVKDIKFNWDGFTDSQRQEMTVAIAPWKTDLADPPRRLSPPPNDDTCFGQIFSNRVHGEHFIVEWNEGIDVAQAEAYADTLDAAWEVFVDMDGWQTPEGADQYKILAYVENAIYGGAYTTTESCGGNLWMPYIVTGKDSFWSDWFIGMAAHEFHHAVQYSYGNGHEFWYWEATATYAEEYANPNMNTWSEYVDGYLDNPFLAMGADGNSDDEFWHMYGMAIWNFYLDQHVGDLQLVQDIWDYSNDHGNFYNISQEEVLTDLGYSFPELYQGFIVTNTVLDYDDPESYSKLKKTDTVEQLPYDGENKSRSAPEYLGQNYFLFTVEPPAPQDLVVSFDGEEDGEWLVFLTGTDDGELVQITEVEVDSGMGEGRLVDFGAYEESWLVISPTKDQRDGFEYTFSTWAEDATGDAEFNNVPEDEPPDDADEDGVNSYGAATAEDGGIAFGSCACDSVTSSLLGWLVLGPIVAIRRRGCRRPGLGGN